MKNKTNNSTGKAKKANAKNNNTQSNSTQNKTFDYFYGGEQSSFFQVPMILIKDPVLRELSDGAKLLYGLLVTRTSLSARNGWKDEYGRVYITYTTEEIKRDINCWDKKAISLMDALREIGLVESIKVGQNIPNRLYVKNCAQSNSQDNCGDFGAVKSEVSPVSPKAKKTAPTLSKEHTKYINKYIDIINKSSQVLSSLVNSHSVTD